MTRYYPPPSRGQDGDAIYGRRPVAPPPPPRDDERGGR